MNTLILLLAIAGSAMSLSCYGFNGYNNRNGSILENKTYCSAFYEVVNGYATFSGGDRDPTKPERFGWDASLNQDCQIKNYMDHIENKEHEVYTCICFTELCNYPFTWEEFKTRGFTLVSKEHEKKE